MATKKSKVDIITDVVSDLVSASAGSGKSSSKKKSSNADSIATITDIVSDIAGGNGIDLEKVGDLVSGATAKKKPATKKKASKADDLVSLLAGGNKDDYPQLSEKAYWGIRAMFQALDELPEKVTASKLTKPSGMQLESVKKYVVPALIVMGLLAKDGTITKLLKAWIDDNKYESACADIRKNAYPTDLLKLGAHTKTEQNAVSKWFQKNLGVSETAAKKMTTVYTLLTEPELKEAKAEKKPAAKKTAADKTSVTVTKKDGKDTVTIKFTVDEEISKSDLTKKFDELFEETRKKL